MADPAQAEIENLREQLAAAQAIVAEVARIKAINADLQDRQCGDPGFLFLRCDGSRLPISSASNAIRRILRDLGMKPPHGRAGARPYEFRHAFAVHHLTAWAEEGIDIHAKLPSLSAYLGHLNIIGTEVYLKATPQLLELASVRFEQHLRHSRQPR